ncbi:hypothetical protein M2103_000937 [Ereboglobus sp. PH5-5]|uniref:hypothetical protein n=1 Tax=unclassified Ereboglobus TaxID=2626932 RepID=UPI0024075966|nr:MULTISPECIES: hypothetical protein [unclassified Ereboglobus]MDF9826533.1 hypothetical protein [Ereboglobus sp. PH5-10]MDF9832723.1 hypothetical protein [Ereboglobus sp. PH5-5]
MLPPNHVFVPIDAASAGQPLRVCIVVNQNPPPSTTTPSCPFVLLRSTLDARVYLGAVLDATGRHREWLEIWIQTVAPLAAAEYKTIAGNDPLTNAMLDARWDVMTRTFIEADPAACIQTGFEQQHPRPACIDLDALAPWHPATPENQPYTLATDDAELLAAGLPAFSSTTARHWRATAPDGKPQFIPAPLTSEQLNTHSAKLHALPQKLHPLNPESGLTFLRRLAPIALDDYAAFLGGRPWKGNASARETYPLDAPLRALSDWDAAQQHGLHLFSTAGGRCGRFIESLHLKLSLLHQALHHARAAIKQRQLPYLNLSADSFRVALDAPDTTLPALWTARLVPVRAGQSMALPIKTADVRYFIALEQPSASVYRPAHMTQSIRGFGDVRIRRVYTDTGDRICVEGTLVTPDRVGHSASDILWLRLPLPNIAPDLFARLDTAEGLAAGEARFRTIPQDLPPEINEMLRNTEGAVFPDTPFETIPLLSAPADLYSLAVLGALLLLVNSGNTLGVATDDLIGYARKLGQEATKPAAPDTVLEPFAARAVQVAEADPRIRAALGPHRLAYDGVTAEDAADWVPPDLWWHIIGTLARLIPGAGPDSYCKDYGDASPFNLEKALDAPLRDLGNLLLRTRGLIISDWTSNREVARVIRKIPTT